MFATPTLAPTLSALPVLAATSSGGAKTVIGFCAALLNRTEKQLQAEFEELGTGSLLEYCSVKAIQSIGPRFVFEHARLAFSMLAAVSHQAPAAQSASASAEPPLLPVEDAISRDVWQKLVPSFFPALADVASAQAVFDALLDAQKRLENRKQDKEKDSKSSKKTSKDKSKDAAEEDEEDDEIVAEPVIPSNAAPLLQFATFERYVTALEGKLDVRSTLESEKMTKLGFGPRETLCVHQPRVQNTTTAVMARGFPGDLWITDRSVIFKKPKVSLIGPRLFRYNLMLPAKAEPKSHRTLTTRHTGILITHSVPSASSASASASSDSPTAQPNSPPRNSLSAPSAESHPPQSAHSPHSPQAAAAQTPKSQSAASSLTIAALPGYSLEQVHLIIMQAVGSSRRDALLPVLQEVIATHALVREHFPLETASGSAASASVGSAVAGSSSGDKADRKFFGLLPASSSNAIAPVSAAVRDAATEVACALTYLAIARYQAVREIVHCAYPTLLPLVSALESKRAAELHRAHATRTRAFAVSAACRDVLARPPSSGARHSNAELLTAMWSATVAATAAQFSANANAKQPASAARRSLDASAAAPSASAAGAASEPALDPHDRKALADADETLRSVVAVARKEEDHEDLIRQRERDAEFDNMSQSIALLSAVLKRIAVYFEPIKDVFSGLLDWRNPPLTLFVFFCLLWACYYDLLGYVLPLFLCVNAITLFYLQRQREKGRIKPIVRPDKSKESLITKLKKARARQLQVTQKMQDVNRAVLKLRALYTFEDARMSSIFFKVVILASIVTFFVPFRALFAGLCLHVFTQKFRSHFIKEMILRFWANIPPAPVIER